MATANRVERRGSLGDDGVMIEQERNPHDLHAVPRAVHRPEPVSTEVDMEANDEWCAAQEQKLRYFEIAWLFSEERKALHKKEKLLGAQKLAAFQERYGLTETEMALLRAAHGESEASREKRIAAL